jgi:aerobic-type carbon monoxide dehydrogenase small subunit (CoxS/CutS family)
MQLTINGEDVEVDDRRAKTPLVWVLRDVLGDGVVPFCQCISVLAPLSGVRRRFG